MLLRELSAAQSANALISFRTKHQIQKCLLTLWNSWSASLLQQQWELRWSITPVSPHHQPVLGLSFSPLLLATEPQQSSARDNWTTSWISPEGSLLLGWKSRDVDVSKFTIRRMEEGKRSYLDHKSISKKVIKRSSEKLEVWREWCAATNILISHSSLIITINLVNLVKWLYSRRILVDNSLNIAVSFATGWTGNEARIESIDMYYT